MFLDTSLLVKLYYEEEGTEALDEFLRTHFIEAIYLSEISKVEFRSAVWKKLKTKEIEETDAIALLNGFKADYDKYTFIIINKTIIDGASDLIVKYGSLGLKTLDAVQLSCAIEDKDQISIAKTADEKLEECLKREGIN